MQFNEPLGNWNLVTRQVFFFKYHSQTRRFCLNLMNIYLNWNLVYLTKPNACPHVVWHFYASATKSRGILIYPCPSIRPSGYRYMVCPAISSYSFRATALIFCRMFIHMMEVCMSTGLVIFLCPRDEKSGGGIFVKYSHKMTGGWTSFPSY